MTESERPQSNNLGDPINQGQVDAFFRDLKPLTSEEVVQERAEWQEAFDELREEVRMPEFLDALKKTSTNGEQPSNS